MLSLTNKQANTFACIEESFSEKANILSNRMRIRDCEFMAEMAISEISKEPPEGTTCTRDDMMT